MSRLLFIALLIGLLLCAPAHGATGQEIYILVDRDEITRIVMPERVRYDSLSAERQAEMLRAIKAQRDSTDAEVRSDAWRSLISLEDEEAIAIVVKTFLEDPYSDAYPGALSFAAPSLLPHLIDAIYNGATKLTDDERMRALKNDDWFFSTRARALHMAIGKLSGWKQFPAATQEWATVVGIVSFRAPDDIEDELAAAQFKAWWEHNKEAVLAKDYAKATWLPTEVPDPIARYWQPPGAKATVTPAPRPASAPAAVIPPAPAASRLPWLLGGLAALALAAVAARTLRHR